MYEIYARLRDGAGLKDSEVARMAQISPVVLSEWKKGKATPKADKMQRIADALGVSMEYLMTGEIRENYYINPETAKVAQEIAENRELALLFDAARDATPEDLITTHQVLLALKRKEEKREND